MKVQYLIACCVAAALSPAASATTVQVAGGSGQRSLAIADFDPLGQAFTATDTRLDTFGFQILTANAGAANSALTFTLLNGSGFGGSVVTTQSVTLSGIPATRTPTWFDLTFTGVSLVAGQSYTALLTSESNRYALIYGPDINLFTGMPTGGDAYAGGRLLATNLGSNPSCDAGICDANFRFTATTPAGVIPEPATWAMMIGGFALTGGALRRRAGRVAYA